MIFEFIILLESKISVFIKTNLLLFLIVLAVSCDSSSSKYYDIGQIKTPFGEMLFWLYEETPNHKKSFLSLSGQYYWDTLTFNRVIKNFVIQGGCPDTPEGFKNSPYLIAPEFQPNIRHIYGALGAGRDDNPTKLSTGCQLYIVHNKNGIPRLDDNYVIFGQLFNGFDVLEHIANMKTDTLDLPLTPITMEVNTIKLSKKELIQFRVPWVN